MAVLPAEIPTGLVTGQYYFVNEDNVDADTDPDLTVVTGTVRFTCSAKVLRMPTKLATVIPLVFDAVFNSNGVLTPAGGTGTGIELPATNSTLFSPVNFTWRVDFDLRELATGYSVVVPSFDIQVPVGTTVDLTLATPVDTSPGTITVQGPPGPNTIPTDDAIATAINGTGPTKTALVAAVAVDPTVTANTASIGPALAYRKRIIHRLPFKSPNYDAAKALWGDFYPQSFAVDATRDELFIISANTTSTKQIVSIYTWSTGAYKSCFAYACTVVSEGSVVKYESGVRYLYTRTGASTLSRFVITTNPTNLTSITAADSYAGTAAGVNFTYRNGFWTANDSMPPIGNGVESRGWMKRMDDTFTVVGQMQFPESYSGGNTYKYRDNSLPKMQGFTEAEGYFALSIGGYHKVGDPVTPYAYQGIRLISGQGELLLDALIKPDLMAAKLQANGLNPTRIESEGVILVGKSLYSLNVIGSYNATTDPVGPDNVGILIMEELSKHPAAIDFSDCSVTWTQTPALRTQAGLHPRGSDGKLHNMITNEVLDTLPKIMDYMIAVNQSVFQFYSSSVTVTDTDGTAYPAGNHVTVYNANNSTFFVQVRGSATDTGMTMVYPDGGTPGAFIAKKYSPKGTPAWMPTTNRTGVTINTLVLLMAHMIDVGQTVYSFYSSNTTMTDTLGYTIPAGNYVNVYNPNSSTFFVQVMGTDAAAWKIFPDGAGGFTQTSVPLSTFPNTITAPALRLTNTGDASATSTTHALQIGPTSGPNLILDVNEIMARDNGALVPVFVEGGVDLGTVTPTAASAVRKDYVDTQIGTRAPTAHNHLWADTTDKPTTFAPSAHQHPMTDLTGTLTPAQLPVATGSAAGSMSAADKAKLDTATFSATGSALAQRHSTGSIQVVTGTNALDAANKGYVDKLGVFRAAGTVSVPVIAAGATTTVTVTFPASRFTVAPIYFMNTGDGHVTVGSSTISTTSAVVTLCNYTSAASVASTGNWDAVQMTSSTAAG